MLSHIYITRSSQRIFFVSFQHCHRYLTVAIRFYIPPNADADPADKEAPTAAEQLQQRIMQTASIRKTTGDVLVSFPQEQGTFLTPRGRYGIELYDYFLRMRGQKYDYKIKVRKEGSGGC